MIILFIKSYMYIYNSYRSTILGTIFIIMIVVTLFCELAWSGLNHRLCLNTRLAHSKVKVATA